MGPVQQPLSTPPTTGSNLELEVSVPRDFHFLLRQLQWLSRPVINLVGRVSSLIIGMFELSIVSVKTVVEVFFDCVGKLFCLKEDFNPPGARSQAEYLARETPETYPVVNVRGIFNIGNSCYINSVLQTMFSVPGFAQALEAYPEGGNSANDRTVNALKKIHTAYFTGKPLIRPVSDFRQALLKGRYILNMTPETISRQYDAFEVMRLILDILGLGLSTIEYKGFIVDQEYKIISLPPDITATGLLLPVTQQSSLQELINQFSEKGVVSDPSSAFQFELQISGEAVKHQVDQFCSKTVIHGEPPPVLCIQLIRDLGRYYGLPKNLSPIEFPPDGLLDLSCLVKTGENLRYEIKACIVHSGTEYGGHYYTFVKKRDQWFLCDDRMARSVTVEAMLVRAKRQGYIVVLEKVVNETVISD